MGCSAAAGAGLCVRTPEPTSRAYQAFDRGDWAWEFLRRNTGYESDWRASTPRRVHAIAMSDGTSVPSLTNDSQIGADLRVCADEED